MEVNRKLASIRKISAIKEIPGADNIVCVVVDGWELVTQKSNGFKEGDLVCYFEIDSVLPEREEFEFLRERCYVSAERSVNGAGFRLKTIKLRGQVSQGLILPLDTLSTPSEEIDGAIEFIQIGKAKETSDGVDIPMEIITVIPEEGDDLTEILGVVKFERPLPSQLAGMARGNFPSFIPKTDAERVENFYKYLVNKYSQHTWEITMKLDGSSFTCYYRTHPDLSEGQFGVCSRNIDLQETEENAYWRVARKYDLENKMGNLGRSLAIQGELMGPGVQGNRENLSDLQMFVFNIWDIDKQSYLTAEERYEICEKFDLQHVPVLGKSLDLSTSSLQNIREMADGPSLFNKIREGIVFKSLTDPNVSFKSISHKFLLKED